jgi:hypothetical protein
VLVNHSRVTALNRPSASPGPAGDVAGLRLT